MKYKYFEMEKFDLPTSSEPLYVVGTFQVCKVAFTKIKTHAREIFKVASDERL